MSHPEQAAQQQQQQQAAQQPEAQQPASSADVLYAKCNQKIKQLITELRNDKDADSDTEQNAEQLEKSLKKLNATKMTKSLHAIKYFFSDIQSKPPSHWQVLGAQDAPFVQAMLVQTVAEAIDETDAFIAAQQRQSQHDEPVDAPPPRSPQRMYPLKHVQYYQVCQHVCKFCTFVISLISLHIIYVSF